MIPGSNLLKTALSLIAPQSIIYYKANGRALNNIGQDVTTYDTALVVRGSFQPVPRRLYQSYGLDFQKSYFTFYASVDVIDLQRDVSADQIAFKGARYQCESANDWFAMDGWTGVLCALITSPNLDIDRPIYGFDENNSSNGNFNYNNGDFK